MRFDYDFDSGSVKGIEEDHVERHEIFLTDPQTKFIKNKAKFPLFIAGFGAGKSTTLGVSVLNDLNMPYSGIKIGVYCPTYDLLKLITIPYLEELLFHAGIKYKLNKSDFIFHLETGDQIIMRSMDNPARIVGYQTFRAHIDEMDTLVEDKAEDAWNKIIARNRQPIPIVNEDGEYEYVLHKNLDKEEQESRKPDRVLIGGKFIKVRPGNGTHCLQLEFNRVSAYSTPEGFRFCYNKWAKNPEEAMKKGYEMIQAPTYSNPNLKPDYIQGLRDTYPAQLIEAYLEGRFVNLTSGAVYPDFDRILNHTDEAIKDHEVLHVGMDFNVNNMSAAIFVIRNSIIYLLDEISGARDTPSLCRLLKEKHDGHQILIYPDSSGQNTSSKSASESDLSIIRSNGFNIRAKSKNPFVKDRVSSVCAKICTANGARTFFVNTNNCPVSTECLEQQIWTEAGEPDKKAGKDHMNDAIGYFIHYNYPIVKKIISRGSVTFHAR